GKTAEEVAKEISRIFLEDIKEDALDRYTSDQILPYLAFLGGKIKIAGFSDHVESNIKVVEKFLEIKINKDYDKKFVYI
ncbi:MAG: RNA 3'-terminal phosphate cyclase, partial [Endomicrobiia bacterium]